MKPSSKNILILDRDESFLSLYRYLIPNNMTLIETSSFEEARNILIKTEVDLVICDDAFEADLEDIFLIKNFLNLTFPVIAVSGAFCSTDKLISNCYAFISKNDLKQEFLKILMIDSPLWTSNTIKT